jgi:hypothetical protein
MPLGPLGIHHRLHGNPLNACPRCGIRNIAAFLMISSSFSMAGIFSQESTAVPSSH